MFLAPFQKRGFSQGCCVTLLTTCEVDCLIGRRAQPNNNQETMPAAQPPHGCLSNTTIRASPRPNPSFVHVNRLGQTRERKVICVRCALYLALERHLNARYVRHWATP